MDSFVQFHEALSQGPDALASFFDWDAMLTLLAVDRVIINDDGALHFWCFLGGRGNEGGGGGNHNCYWYEEQRGGWFWLIPWDMDSSFAGSQSVLIKPEWREPAQCACAGSLVPASCDPVVQAFIAREAGFEAHVDRFLSGPFAKTNVDGLLSRWADQIAPHVMESAGILGAPTFAEWQEALDRLRRITDSARNDRGYPYETGPDW